MALKRWNFEQFGNINSNIKLVERELDFIRISHSSSYCCDKGKPLRRELDELHKRKETHWFQKSRIN